MVPGGSGCTCTALLPVDGKADRGESETLFEGPPPGDPIPIDVSQFDVRDDEPDDKEIREVVRARLKNGRASGASQLCAEDVKGWLRGMEDEEDPEKRAEGAGDQWRLFVALIQLIWRTGEIPQQMLWTIIACAHPQRFFWGLQGNRAA